MALTQFASWRLYYLCKGKQAKHAKSLVLKWLIKERPHCMWYVQLTNLEGCVSFLKDDNALQFPSIFSLRALVLFWTPLSEDTFRHPLSSLCASLVSQCLFHDAACNILLECATSLTQALQWMEKAMKSYDQPRQHIKKQRHYFANKGPSSQSYGFSSSHV